MVQPKFVKRIQKKEKERKERQKERRRKRREKKRKKDKGKEFKETVVTQRILTTPQKAVPKKKIVSPRKTRKKPKVIRIPTKQTLAKRKPRQFQQEIRKLPPTVSPEVKQLVRQGFKVQEARDKIRLESLKKAQLQRKKIVAPTKITPRQQLVEKVFKRPVTRVPKKIQITLKDSIQRRQKAVKDLERLGFKEGNLKGFLKKADTSRKEKVKKQIRQREREVNQEITSFIKRANLEDSKANKDAIRQAVEIVGINPLGLDEINTVKQFENRITDFTLEGLYKYGTQIVGVNVEKARNFASNRNVEGFNKLIKDKIFEKEKEIRFKKGLFDIEKADELKSYYDKIGIAKPISLNRISYYIVGKDGKLKGATRELSQKEIRALPNIGGSLVTSAGFRRNLGDLNKRTNNVNNPIPSSVFNRIGKSLFRGIETINKGTNLGIKRRDVNLLEKDFSQFGFSFAKELGKYFFNLATSIPRATKKVLFIGQDSLTKSFSKEYKQSLLKNGFDSPKTQRLRKELIRNIAARQIAKQDIRQIDPNFDPEKNPIFDQDLIETGLLLVGGPLFGKAVSGILKGTAKLGASTNRAAALLGNSLNKATKGSLAGLVGAQVGVVAFSPTVENVGNLLLIGGGLNLKSKSLIKKLKDVNIRKKTKLKKEIQELEKLGVDPRLRESRQATKLRKLKKQLFDIESQETTFIEKLDKLRKSVSRNKRKVPNKSQKTQLKKITTRSKNLKKKKIKVEKTLKDFEKKPKPKKEKQLTTQKEIKDRLQNLIKQSRKTGKKVDLKNFLLFVRVLRRPTLMKTIKKDLRDKRFKFQFKKSKKTGRTFVDLKTIRKAEIKEPEKKLTAKDKKILREIDRRPKREEVTIKRLKKEIEIVKKSKNRASEKALQEDIEQGIKNALKKNISFRQEILLGVKRSSLSKKQINDILEGVIEGQRKPKIIKNTIIRFDNQIKQTQKRISELKKELNKMIGYSQITEKGFTVLKKKARKKIPQIKKTIQKLQIELKNTIKNRSEFLSIVKKNKLDVVKTSTQLEEQQFARRQKQFKEFAKNKKIKFEEEINVKPKSNEVTMKVFLGKKLGTIEIIYKAPKTSGFRKLGKKAQARLISLPKSSIKIRHKAFNKKAIKIIDDKVARQIQRDPRKKQVNKLFDNGRRQRRQIENISKRRKTIDKPKLSQSKIKKVNKSLDLIENAVKKINLNSIALSIANIIGFDTFNLRKSLDIQISAVLKKFKQTQQNINDFEKQVTKEIKQQKEKKVVPKKVVKKKKFIPKKVIRKKLVKRQVKRRRIKKKKDVKKKPKKKKALLTLDSKLPKGVRFNFDAQFRERKNPNIPYNKKTNPRKTKFVDLNLPRNRAARRVLKEVDRTNPRGVQFVLDGTTKKKDTKPAKILKKFRRRKTKKTLRFVEKSKFAIDTRGEKKGLALSKAIKKSLKKKVKIKTKPKSRVKTKRLPKIARKTKKSSRIAPKRTRSPKKRIKKTTKPTQKRKIIRKPKRTLKKPIKRKRIVKKPIRRKTPPKRRRKTPQKRKKR